MGEGKTKEQIKTSLLHIPFNLCEKQVDSELLCGSHSLTYIQINISVLIMLWCFSHLLPSKINEFSRSQVMWSNWNMRKLKAFFCVINNSFSSGYTQAYRCLVKNFPHFDREANWQTFNTLTYCNVWFHNVNCVYIVVDLCSVKRRTMVQVK